MRRDFVLGRPSRSVRILHLTEVACELFELPPQLIDLAALIDDHLIQVGKRLLCMHQDAFDVGQALVGRLGQVNPLVSISAGSKFANLEPSRATAWITDEPFGKCLPTKLPAMRPER